MIFGVIVLLSLSTTMFLVSLWRQNNDPYFKQYSSPSTMLLFVRFFHYLIVNFIWFAAFIFGNEVDLFYILLGTLTLGHWLFVGNECALSVVEKKLYYGDYIPGTDVSDLIYMRLVFGDHHLLAEKILSIVGLICSLIIICRATVISMNLKIMLLLLFITYGTILNTSVGLQVGLI